MTQLAFDFDIEPVEPEWVPIVAFFADVKAGRDAWKLTSCRDCGGKASAFRGGARDGAGFRICYGCSYLDGCEERGGDETPPKHVSRWGDSHSPERHDELIQERLARRAKWRQK